MSDLIPLFAALARVVVVGRHRPESLDEITGLTRRALSGCEAASITLIRDGRAHTAAHDGPMALAADELQYERGHGPCVDAATAAQVFLLEDIGTDNRWPGYTAAVAAHGVGSALPVPLPFQTSTIGAVNFYAGRPRAFSAADIGPAQDIAGVVAFVVGNADLAAQPSEELAHMRTAMLSRAVIEQAKGILMERHKGHRIGRLHHAVPLLPKGWHQAPRHRRRARPHRIATVGRPMTGDGLAAGTRRPRPPHPTNTPHFLRRTADE